MSNIDEKLSKMTRAQANALADHLNAGYNKPAYKPTAKTKKKTTARGCGNGGVDQNQPCSLPAAKNRSRQFGDLRLNTGTW